MSRFPEIAFAPLSSALEPTTVILVGGDGALAARGRQLDKETGGALGRAMQAADFKGKARAAIEALGLGAPAPQRLILIGTGDAKSAKDLDWTRLGGAAMGQIGARKTKSATLVAETGEKAGKASAEVAADIALGVLLRSYRFDKYRTRPATDDNGERGAERDGLERLVVLTDDPAAAEAAFMSRRALAEGVAIARDLVNEPANELGPVEFAERARELTRVGVEVEVIEPAALAEMGMRALLGVAQGSVRPARVVVMQWHGAKSKRAKPLCFIGKGVVFDTGGISMKPAAGMEDMKGDMGGAACVTGLMHALAARKANVNAIGIIGLVENMPSGTAQRPGDIVRAMNGATIEILNTDAEGRLVLADLLWYAQTRLRHGTAELKPRLMVNLATLTGAIMVALGKEFAGLFSNDDRLAGELAKAGEATGERVWRMPLDPAYDKLIDSKNADMKNIGGRFGGAITAAQFLQRFVKDTPWAHIDIAGTAMDSTRGDINQSWGSGWGVRLLDRMVADHHE